MITLRTSERLLYKRCRRRWHLQSQNRGNYVSKSESSIHLWFGSGWHFALEDFHGYNRFGSPYKAFQGYYDAFKRGGLPLPNEADEYLELASGMSDHYEIWLEDRDEFKTLWIDGEPQVEVNALIDLPELGIYYSLTIDRVVIDPYDRVWINDYKTVAQFDTGKLETDPQITSYLLFAPSIYPDIEFEGMLYMQFKKSVPKEPAMLARGGFSLNKSQAVTYGSYLKALKNYYGQRIPKTYVPFLQMLKSKEDIHGDAFIRRDFVRRGKAYLDAELEKILMEGKEMFSPDLPIYPNPTRDCAWDCPVRPVCLAMDDGSDWEAILNDNYMQYEENKEWRDYIQYPEVNNG